LSTSPAENVERRKMPRIYFSFPALIRGANGLGEAFETDTVLDNLSAGGFYLRLTHGILPGAKVFVVIQLSADSGKKTIAPRVAANGFVVRAERRSPGNWGIGVAFHRHRFL
jgi:hypothetical protein